MLLVLTVAAMMAAMLVVMAAPAFAKWSNCGGKNQPACGWKILYPVDDDDPQGIGWGVYDYS